MHVNACIYVCNLHSSENNFEICGETESVICAALYGLV